MDKKLSKILEKINREAFRNGNDALKTADFFGYLSSILANKSEDVLLRHQVIKEKK